MAALVVLLVGAAAGAEEILLDIGTSAPRPQLGFGWGRAERSRGVNFRWIRHLEADVSIDIRYPGDAELTVRAAPQYLPYTRQVVSVYVNRAYVGEWICADAPGFATHRMTVPARFWRPGPNLLTLRLAYCKRAGTDEREMALCVDTIAVRME